MEHAHPAAIALLLILLAPVFIAIYRAKKGHVYEVRRIPGIDAIDDALGRSVELGRPISFTSGLTGIDPLLFACLGVLKHIAKKAAIFDSRLFVPSSDPQTLALTDATIQSAYRSQKKFSSYDPTTVRFLSEEQFAFASGYMGLVHRENVGASFLLGSFAAEALILAEAGQQIGAVQVAGTTSQEQIPFFLTACDYTLIGEEVFAASAYLAKDPVQLGSLRGQDFGKVFFAVLIIAGVIFETLVATNYGFKSNPISDFLKRPWVLDAN